MLRWAYLPNCRLRHFLHGGRDARGPRGRRARCKLVVLVMNVLIGETPMRAPPAEYNSALRRDQASLLGVGLFA